MRTSGVGVARGRAKAAAGGPVEGPWALPEGWRWERLGNIAYVIAGQSPPSEICNRDGVGLPFFQGKAEFGKDYPDPRNWCANPQKVADVGDLLISVRAPVGPTNVANMRCGIGRGLAAVRPHAVKITWLRYWLSVTTQTLREKATGTTFEAITGDVLRSHVCPIPPEGLEDSIVARIDALFTDLEDGEAALAQARTDLGTWRKALLKAAVTGELTADWRAANPLAETGADLLARILDDRRARWICEPRNRGKRYVEPDAPKTDDLPPIPHDWAWTTVETAGDVLLGRQRAPEHHAGEHMRPYLRVANVMEDRLDLRDVKKMNFTPSEFETFALRSGDVLLNEGQSPELLGRPAIYRGEIPGCCFQKTLLRFRPTTVVTPEFALIVFRRYMHGGRFRRESRITTNIGHLTQVRFLPIEFPLPPLEEQREIAARVEAAEAAWEGAVLGADLGGPLRRSILAAAFRGELVA